MNGGRTLSKKFRNKYIKGSVRFLVKTQKHPGAPWVKTEEKLCRRYRLDIGITVLPVIDKVCKKNL